MATEILKKIQENCPRDWKTIQDHFIQRTEDDTLLDLVQGAPYSYYVAPLRNGILTKSSDIIVGFIATTPTTFTLSFGNSESVDFIQTRTLTSGVFQYTLFHHMYPRISSLFQHPSISKFKGSGYVIFANIWLYFSYFLSKG